MTKIDEKLVERLETMAKAKGLDLNTVLAHMVGVCPTCGQDLPTKGSVREEPVSPHAVMPPATATVAPEPEAADAEAPIEAEPTSVSMRARIVDWMAKNATGKRGDNVRCAEALGTDAQYVASTMSLHRQQNPGALLGARGRPTGAGAKSKAIVAFLKREKKDGNASGAQKRAADKFGVTPSGLARSGKGT